MSESTDPADRARELLEKIDVEVERRKLREGIEPPAPEPEAQAEAQAQADLPDDPDGPEAAPPVPAPGPGDAKPISVPFGGEPLAATTPEELASGVAAARRRLAILTTQIDALAAQIMALSHAMPGGPARLPGAPVPSPMPMPEPAAPDEAPDVLAEDDPEAVVIPEVAPPPAEHPAPTADWEQPAAVPAEPEPEPEPPAPAIAPADAYLSLRMRPRPPGQHQRTTPSETARNAATEMARAGHSRGEVARVLTERYGVGDPDAVLDALFLPGS